MTRPLSFLFVFLCIIFPRAMAQLIRLSILSCRQQDDHEVILDYSHHPPVKLTYIFSQDWGASCDVDDVSIKWHIPSLEEKTFAKELLETFLLPVLDRLTQFTQGNEMTRYVLRHLSGKKPVFPPPPPPPPRPLPWMHCTCHMLGGGFYL